MRSEKARNIFAVLGAIFVYMSFGIKFTTGNLNPYLKPFLNISNGETVWFHATIVSCQAVAAPIGSVVAKKIGVLPVVIIGCLISRYVHIN